VPYRKGLGFLLPCLVWTLKHVIQKSCSSCAWFRLSPRYNEIFAFQGCDAVLIGSYLRFEATYRFYHRRSSSSRRFLLLALDPWRQVVPMRLELYYQSTLRNIQEERWCYNISGVGFDLKPTHKTRISKKLLETVTSLALQLADLLSRKSGTLLRHAEKKRPQNSLALGVMKSHRQISLGTRHAVLGGTGMTYVTYYWKQRKLQTSRRSNKD
jgi:hypothetical protein